MIALGQNFLLFELACGETIPFSAEMISVELVGDTADLFDPEFVKHASAAVFHYFRHELERTTVSVGEFTLALEKVLRGLALTARTRPSIPVTKSNTDPNVVESDLCRLADDAGKTELFFFPRLRDELRTQLLLAPRLLRFSGLRGCVKGLAGARRWTPRCQTLQDQIVDYLRGCLSAESPPSPCALVVV